MGTKSTLADRIAATRRSLAAAAPGARRGRFARPGDDSALRQDSPTGNPADDQLVDRVAELRAQQHDREH